MAALVLVLSTMIYGRVDFGSFGFGKIGFGSFDFGRLALVALQDCKFGFAGLAFVALATLVVLL